MRKLYYDEYPKKINLSHIKDAYLIDESISVHFTEGDGCLEFMIGYFPGQCGAVIYYGFEFMLPYADTYYDHDTYLKDLGEKFFKHLATLDRNVAKIVFSAVQDSELDVMLRTQTCIQMGSVSRNPNSGNMIRVFELDTKDLDMYK